MCALQQAEMECPVHDIFFLVATRTMDIALSRVSG